MRLSEKFTREVLAGRRPALTDEPELTVGRLIHLKREVSISITKRVKANQWAYSVRDDRPRLLRRSPPALRLKKGHVQAPNAEEVKDAAEESGYTHSSAQALADAGEAVDEATQRRFSMEAGAATAWSQTQQYVQAQVIAYERRLNDARKRGKRSTVRAIRRDLERLTARLNEASVR